MNQASGEHAREAERPGTLQVIQYVAELIPILKFALRIRAQKLRNLVNVFPLIHLLSALVANIYIAV
jgi:hypothetical protein